MFRRGQKIVCVNDSSWNIFFEAYVIRPVKGDIYTIRDIIPGDAIDPMISFHLYEITNDPFPHPVGLLEPSFLAHRFRPIITRSTDISFATKILDNINEKVDA